MRLDAAALVMLLWLAVAEVIVPPAKIAPAFPNPPALTKLPVVVEVDATEADKERTPVETKVARVVSAPPDITLKSISPDSFATVPFVADALIAA